MIKQICPVDKNNITKESGTINVIIETGETVEIKYMPVDGLTRYVYDDKYKESIKLGDLFKLSEYIDDVINNR